MKIDENNITAKIGCSACPEEWFLNVGNERVAYIRLRFGRLDMYPANTGGIDWENKIYTHKFRNMVWVDNWKGQFKDDIEREKYLTKCKKKLVKWFNKKYKDLKEPV